eukprot:1195910-Prorocentrum_minimum.AAC.3
MPTEHKPTEHEPNEHRPTEHEPTEHRPTEHEPTEHRPTEHEPTEHRPTEHEPTEHRPTEHEPTEYEAITTGIGFVCLRPTSADANEEVRSGELARELNARVLNGQICLSSGAAGGHGHALRHAAGQQCRLRRARPPLREPLLLNHGGATLNPTDSPSIGIYPVDGPVAAPQ